MKSLKLASFSCLLAALSFGQVSNYTLTTVIGLGSGGPGNTGNGGPAINATLNFPAGIARDASGKLYIADTFNYYIRMVGTDNNISLFAGGGVNAFGGDGGPANVAQIGSAYGIAVDKAGNVYFTDASSSVIRKVTTDGKIATVGGNQAFGFGGDGEVATSVDAFLGLPTGLALDSAGSIYFCDTANNRIRKINAADQILSTVVGQGDANYGGDGGPAIDAKLNTPMGITFDAIGNMYIADTGNHVIRKVTLDGNISTVAGNGNNAFSGDGDLATTASLNYPKAVVVDASGNIFIADTYNSRIRQVAENGRIYTIAGNGLFGDYNGNNNNASDAQFRFPAGLMLDGNTGGIYVVDTDNSEIKYLTPAAQAPQISRGGVISSSQFGAFGAASPGTWVEIYGFSLANTTRPWAASDFKGDVAPQSLSGTSVTIGGKPAYVAYVSPTQVNVQIPSGVASGNQDVVVTTAQASAPVSVQINATQPGLYAPSQFLVAGKQYAGAILPDNSFGLPANAITGITSRPARPGEIITLYGIGFGPVSPVVNDGQVVRAADAVVLPLDVMIGSGHAQIVSASLVSGSMGLYQINLVVPAVSSGSAVPLTFKLNSQAGQQNLYIAIGQ